MALMTPRFGDRIENTSAGEGNPTKFGYFVEVKVVRGRLNRGKWWRLTDKAGKFWETKPEACINHSGLERQRPSPTRDAE